MLPRDKLVAVPRTLQTMNALSLEGMRWSSSDLATGIKDFIDSRRIGASNVLASAGGTFHAPDAAEVISSATFGVGDAVSGGYDVSDVSPGNIRSGASIGGVAGDSNVVNTSSGNAGSSDIKVGKVAWVDGQAVAGSIPTRTLSPDNDTVQEGFYEATTLSAVDTDLVATSIKSGTNLFGVVGTAGAFLEPYDDFAPNGDPDPALWTITHQNNTSARYDNGELHINGNYNRPPNTPPGVCTAETAAGFGTYFYVAGRCWAGGWRCSRRFSKRHESSSAIRSGSPCLCRVSQGRR